MCGRSMYDGYLSSILGEEDITQRNMSMKKKNLVCEFMFGEKKKGTFYGRFWDVINGLVPLDLTQIQSQ